MESTKERGGKATPPEEGEGTSQRTLLDMSMGYKKYVNVQKKSLRFMEGVYATEQKDRFIAPHR